MTARPTAAGSRLQPARGGGVLRVDGVGLVRRCTPHTVYFGSFAYDRFGLFVNAIILVSTALVLMISPQYLNRRGLHFGEYYSLILAAATGMMLLAGASSLMVIFLAIELLSSPCTSSAASAARSRVPRRRR